MDLTPKQQTSEALRQAETVLIATAQQPTVEQASAVLALAMILRKLGKKVTAIITDPLPPAIQTLNLEAADTNLSGLRDFILKLDLTKAEVDRLKYTVEDGKLNIFITPFKGGFAPNDVTYTYGQPQYDVALVLAVPQHKRLDKVFSQNPGLYESVPIVNIDYHRNNENYGAINLVEPNAASLGEILMALAESLQTGLVDAPIATALLAGIVSATDRFTAQHTTAKALTVAAQLMAAGANQQQVIKALYGGKDNDRGRDRNRDKQKNQPQPSQPAASPTTPRTEVVAAPADEFQIPSIETTVAPNPQGADFDQVAESFNQPVDGQEIKYDPGA